MKRFRPQQPDPYLRTDADSSPAKFGHLNAIVDALQGFDANQTITAQAGGGQASATPLIIGFNLVTTATTGDSVILPCITGACTPCSPCKGESGPLAPVIIKNNGPGSLNIYPCVGESIDDLAANQPIVLDAGSSIELTDLTCTNWQSYANSTDPAFTGVNSVTGCGVDNTDPANPVVNAPFVAPVSPTEALTGDGCSALTPLSVCIDNVTITKDVNGCLQALPSGVQSLTGCNVDNTDPANPIINDIVVDGVTITGTGCPGDPLVAAQPAATLGYAEYVQHTQGSNISVAPGSAIEYLTDNPLGVFNTIGITTTTGPGGQGTEFLLPIGVYVIDFENSADAAWSLAIYKSLVTQTEVIDTNTIAGASTATTWIHGRSILSAAAPTYIIVSPVTGTQAIPTAGTAAGEFIARLTILKIA